MVSENGGVDGVVAMMAKMVAHEDESFMRDGQFRVTFHYQLAGRRLVSVSPLEVVKDGPPHTSTHEKLRAYRRWGLENAVIGSLEMDALLAEYDSRATP